MSVKVAHVEAIVVSLPRDTPYLGPLGHDERVDARGYGVRAGNRTIYPTTDMSVLLKATADDGTVGWGETYGIVAPEAVVAIVDDVLGPQVVGRDPRDAVAIQEDLYDLMRVRGHFGGYYVDAIAGIDIALWDLFGKVVGQPVAKLLGGHRAESVPAYVSGLPGAALADKVALACDFAQRGFSAFKYAAAVSFDGIEEEMRALREALGDDVELMVDLHWRYDVDEALAVIDALAPYRPRFAEAPCAPEDIAGLAAVATKSRVPIAAGEEWRNDYEAAWRLDAAPLAVVQPEIAHTGVTQFGAIAARAAACGAALMPHATIGVGIFMAASLHATAAAGRVPYHEYQHSVFDRNLRYVDTAMACEAGYYRLPDGPGHGATPRPELWTFVRR